MSEQTDYFWHYGQIRFSREQIIWVIQYAHLFHQGMWPPEPYEYLTDKYNKDTKKWAWVLMRGGSIAEMPISARGFGSEGHFIKPVEIISEIENRLKFTKKDGKILVAQINGNISEYEDLDDDAKNALDYISLWDFRGRPNYALWLAKRRYRNIPKK